VVDRLAAAFQRLEKADNRQGRRFESARRGGDVPPPMRFDRRTDRRRRDDPDATRARGLREARRRAEEARLQNEATRPDSRALAEA